MNRNRWILVVDDDEHDLNWSVEALERENPPVGIVTAYDGIDALDYLQCRGEYTSRPPGNPELVLLDLHMPRADGFEVLRQIKDDAFLKVIPVIMFSTSRRADDVARSYQLGANAYVVKPVDYRQFVETIAVIRRFWTERNEPPPRFTRPARLATDMPGASDAESLISKHP